MYLLKKVGIKSAVFFFVLLFLIMGFQLSLAQSSETIYVKYDASGAEDGSSWDDAYTDLQAALTAASIGDQIWVAAGIYVPSQRLSVDDPRSAVFQLRNGLSIYGGFAGNETSLTQRDWETNITVLSGDLEGDDITDGNGVVTNPDNIIGDNAYTVVCNNEVDDTAILDGFVITAGKSDVVDHSIMGSDIGGGIYNLQSSPTLSNLIIIGCYAPEDNPTSRTGGGIMNDWQSHPTLTNVTLKSNHGRAMVNRYSNPTLTDVVFEDNIMGGMRNYYSSPTLTDVQFISNGDFWTETPGFGGGMHNGNESSPLLTNVTFQGNYARWHGGGMFNSGSNPTLINVLFSGNASERTGGGVMNSAASSPTLINVTFSGNYAWYQGGAMSNFGSSHPSLTNSIIWHNYAQTFFATSEIYNDGDQHPEFANSIIKGSGGSDSWNDYFGIDGGNNIDIDPLFINQPQFSNVGHAGGNLRLQEISPAIDAGTNSPFEHGGAAYGVTADLDGSPRIDGGSVDMGAYEHQVSAVMVSTLDDLAAAVQNPEVKSIKFGNSITANINANRLINLDFSTYTLTGSVQFDTSSEGSIVLNGSAQQSISGNLTIDAPNATVTNNVKVGGDVVIKDVAGSTWVENADGNDLVIEVQSGTASIIINGDTNTLIVNDSGDGLDILINGSVASAVFNAPVIVEGAENIESAHISSDGVELDENPQQISCSVTFSVVGYGGTITASVEGTTINSGDAVEVGEDIVFIADPDEGYQVKKWIVNNEVQTGETGNNFNLFDHQAAVDVRVVFESTDDEEISLEILKEKVNSFVDDGYLNIGQGRALTQTLSAANRSIERGNIETACNILGAFINQLEAFMRVGHIEEDGGAKLIKQTKILFDQLSQEH